MSEVNRLTRESAEIHEAFGTGIDSVREAFWVHGRGRG
jgi:hypothetical protein